MWYMAQIFWCTWSLRFLASAATLQSKGLECGGGCDARRDLEDAQAHEVGEEVTVHS